MALTNQEIIGMSMELAGLDPEKVIVDTLPGWNRMGYRVKKGEKAVFTARIWRPKSTKQIKEETDEDGNPPANRFYMVDAAYFTNKQVQKIEEEQ